MPNFPSFAERGILKSLTTIVDLPISSAGPIKFLFCVFLELSYQSLTPAFVKNYESVFPWLLEIIKECILLGWMLLP